MYQLLIILFIILAIIGIRHIGTQPEHIRPSLRLRYGLYALLGLAILLVFSGKLHWVAGAIAAVLPIIQRVFPLLLRALPFLKTQKGRSYKVNARNYTFETIYETYTDIVNFEIPASERQDEGKKLALFNGSDFLEIALYKGNTGHVGGASTLMGLRERDVVTVNFI